VAAAAAVEATAATAAMQQLPQAVSYSRNMNSLLKGVLQASFRFSKASFIRLCQAFSRPDLRYAADYKPMCTGETAPVGTAPITRHPIQNCITHFSSQLKNHLGGQGWKQVCTPAAAWFGGCKGYVWGLVWS
jgi:hypothetical protein